MCGEFFYDIFHLIFFSCNLWTIQISFPNPRKKSNLITDCKNLENLAHKVASNEDKPKILISFLSNLIKKCFRSLSIIFLLVFSQCYLIHSASTIVLWSVCTFSSVLYLVLWRNCLWNFNFSGHFWVFRSLVPEGPNFLFR